MDRELGFFGVVLAVIIGLLIFKNTRINALVSQGNPNYPDQQDGMQYGPQGPNDGSNSYSDSGHTISPIFGGGGGQTFDRRGFVYGASRQPSVY